MTDAKLEAAYEFYKDDFQGVPKAEALKIIAANQKADAERDVHAAKVARVPKRVVYE